MVESDGDERRFEVLRSFKITASLFLLIIGCHAQATEPTVITLSCDGTVKTNVGNY
jgi:hypothetical protein